MDMTWASSPRSTIGCVQKWFLRLWYVWRKPCTYLAPILTLCPNGRNEIPEDPCHLGAPSGASKTISETMVCLAKPCTYLTSTLTPSPNGPNEIPHDPRHLGVPSGVSKIIFEPMVRSAQTVHLYCIDTNTVSKRTKMRFHMTHVT